MVDINILNDRLIRFWMVDKRAIKINLRLIKIKIISIRVDYQARQAYK